MLGYDGNNEIDGITQTKIENMMHGAQVAGVSLAKKIDSNKSYGMAYNSNFYGITLLNPQITCDANNDAIYNYYKGKNMKIINNSWSGSYYPNINVQIFSEKTTVDSYYKPLKVNGQFAFENNNQVFNYSNVMSYVNDNDPALKSLMKLSKEGALIVFASGNDGLAGPSLEASLPTYDEELIGWLVVGAIDSEKTEKTANTRSKKSRSKKQFEIFAF